MADNTSGLKRSGRYDIVLYALALIIILLISFGAWYVGRSINYKMSYKDMVEQTIKETVKEECLR